MSTERQRLGENRKDSKGGMDGVKTKKKKMQPSQRWSCNGSVDDFGSIVVSNLLCWVGATQPKPILGHLFIK